MDPVNAVHDSDRAAHKYSGALKKILLVSLIFGMIPVAQRCLGMSGRAVAWTMRQLDAAAFSLARKINTTEY